MSFKRYNGFKNRTVFEFETSYTILPEVETCALMKEANLPNSNICTNNNFFINQEVIFRKIKIIFFIIC